MKIAVLATESRSTNLLLNTLTTHYSDIHVLFERPISRWQLLRRRAMRHGYWHVAGQLCFMLLLPILARQSRSRIADLIERAGLDAGAPRILSLSHIDSVNSQACISWLQALEPDVVILNGTRIVSREILASCKSTFLNTHCGITPAYRGVHGAYWACFTGRPDLAGVTVHTVDAGVDTGDIVYQSAIEIDRYDSFSTYPVKQYIAGIPLMLKALGDLASGNLRTYQRKDIPSGIWEHPTAWQYVWARLTRGIR